MFTQSSGAQVRLPDTLAPRATGHASIPVVLGIRSTGLRPVFDGADAVTAQYSADYFEPSFIDGKCAPLKRA